MTKSIVEETLKLCECERLKDTINENVCLAQFSKFVQLATQLCNDKQCGKKGRCTDCFT